MTGRRHDGAPAQDRRPAGSSEAPRGGTEMSEREVLATIAEVAREHLKWNGALTPDMPLVEALALDSLRQLTLVVELEDRFRIRLDGEDASSLRTVGDLAALIARKLAPSGPHAR